MKDEILVLFNKLGNLGYIIDNTSHNEWIANKKNVQIIIKELEE